MNETLLKALQIPFNTPDLCQLECHNQHLLFDCGVVKHNEGVFCSAYTVEKMSLFIRTEDLLPIPVRLRGAHRARIGGSLYKVPIDTLIELDKIRQNRVLFERKKVEVYVPFLDEYRNIMVLPERVWIYSAIPEQWADQIDMSRRKYNMAPGNPRFILAKTYIDNTSELNNHFRYTRLRVEDFQPPSKSVQANGAVHEYVRRKNFEAITQTVF